MSQRNSGYQITLRYGNSKLHSLSVKLGSLSAVRSNDEQISLNKRFENKLRFQVKTFNFKDFVFNKTKLAASKTENIRRSV